MRRPAILFLLCLGLLPVQAQEIPVPWGSLADSITRITGRAPTAGNSILTYNDGNDFLASLLSDIDAAQSSIDLEYYWFENDKVGRAVRDALIRKAREGVRVRVLADQLVTPLMPATFFQPLRKAGAQVYYYHDLPKTPIWGIPETIVGTRDHRKIVVIDQRIFHTGGMNLCEHILEWKDHNIRLEGPIAAAMGNMFEQHWRQEADAPPAEFVPIPEGEGGLVCQPLSGDDSGILQELYVQAIGKAQRYFWIQTPYMAPPEPVFQALLDAAGRGVDVRILLPEASDWGFMNDITRTYFKAMLKAGIGLYTCGQHYDHGKGFVTDDSLVCCGTMNLDKRSFLLNRENALFFYGDQMAALMIGKYRLIMANSQRVDLSQDAPGPFNQLWRNFLQSIDIYL